ncbi:AraC family transcriptional regulator [Flindersiella endophytica]
MREELPASCRIRAWRPPVAGIAEVFHAHMVDFRYPLHSHDTWAVLIVDDGAIQYDLDTRRHGAHGTRSVTVLPPGVVHNGYPAEYHGQFRKRELYLDSDFLPSTLVGPAVDSSTFSDPALRDTLSRLHERLAAHADPMEVETGLALVAERIRTNLRPGQARPAQALEPGLAERLHDFLDGHLATKITLADAARRFDRTVPHLVRSFKRRYGVSPHAYVIGARIDLARRRLLEGMPPAQVAVEVGFHDQAHLTRHFKRYLSVPPARYAMRSMQPGQNGMGAAG